MGQPVTTNPLVIMLINMTVVFIVLVLLGFLIKLIHMIDPTKHQEEEEALELADEVIPGDETIPAPVLDEDGKPIPLGWSPNDEDEDGVSAEVVAVITAAVAAYGYGGIKAIRPIERSGWKQSGRTHGPRR